MRVTIIHNPGAGSSGTGGVTGEEARALAEDAGWQVTLRSTGDASWAEALRAGDDLVVAAGGDGTVRRVATRLLDGGPPLAILPLGTANNIARAVGITAPPAELVAGWASAERRPLDVGLATAPWGERRFVEAVGVGLVARMLVTHERDDDGGLPDGPSPLDPDVARGLVTLRELAASAPGRVHHVTLDHGEPIEEELLLAEVLNVGQIGPLLPLAPEADAGDGLLDVVLLPTSGRERFVHWLDERLAGGSAPPALPVHRARRVRLSWRGSPLHRDDKPWPKTRAKQRRRWSAARRTPATVEARLGGAIALLAPPCR